MALDPMQPRQLVIRWVEAFNRADPDALASFYTEDAINHQVAEAPVRGRAAIREMFASGFASAKMVCIVENIFADGEWAILEWRDPLGLRLLPRGRRRNRFPTRLLGQAVFLARPGLAAPNQFVT